jgi:uncharacterized protein (DUF58 family)
MNEAKHAVEDERRAAWYARLHRTYTRSTGTQYFFMKRIRPAGFAVGAVLVLAGCLGVGHVRTSVYQFFSLSVAMLGLGVPLAFVRQAKLKAERQVPRHAAMGSPLRYAVRVTNTRRLGISRAWLAETVPDPRPDRDEFVLMREPGEEERNVFDRSFAWFRWQWLVSRKRMFDGGESLTELRLAAGEWVQVMMEITPRRRGVIRLDDLRVCLPDPLGLFQSFVRVAATPATVTVLPRRYRLPLVELPGAAAYQLTGESNTNAIGNSGEFTGLREYRPGDPLRQIHWKSWARVGRPIVKELEDTFYPRYGLVLDTLSTHRHDEGFEECVSVAASFAASLDTGDSLLDLMFVKDEAHMVTAGRGVERAEKLLEVLAGVTPTRSGTLDALAHLVLRHAGDLTSCVVILGGWDDVRRDFLAKLRGGGVVFTVLAVGYGERPAGMPGIWLDAAQVERGLSQLPRKLPVD